VAGKSSGREGERAGESERGTERGGGEGNRKTEKKRGGEKETRWQCMMSRISRRMASPLPKKEGKRKKRHRGDA